MSHTSVITAKASLSSTHLIAAARKCTLLAALMNVFTHIVKYCVVLTVCLPCPHTHSNERKIPVVLGQLRGESKSEPYGCNL